MSISFLSMCRILLQNQIFVMVWLSSHYIQLEILIAAPKLLKKPQYVGMSTGQKKAVIQTKERAWVGVCFTVCFVYYIMRTICIILLVITCRTAEDPSMCRMNSHYYTAVISSSILINLFIVMMFLKSSYMIQCSIEDQRVS